MLRCVSGALLISISLVIFGKFCAAAAARAAAAAASADAMGCRGHHAK